MSILRQSLTQLEAAVHALEDAAGGLEQQLAGTQRDMFPVVQTLDKVIEQVETMLGLKAQWLKLPLRLADRITRSGVMTDKNSACGSSPPISMAS